MAVIQSIPVPRDFAAVLHRIIRAPNVTVVQKGLAADFIIQNDLASLNKLEADIIKGEQDG